VQDLYGKAPPNANPASCVPAPANRRLAVIKAPPAVHEEPSYSSVHVYVDGWFVPPNANPAFCVPAPANCPLAVDKAPPVLHVPAAKVLYFILVPSNHIYPADDVFSVVADRSKLPVVVNPCPKLAILFYFS
jgi:hypothetical protein